MHWRSSRATRSTTKPVSGDVWRYDYLWCRECESGETEGRKRRPVALIAIMRDEAGRTHLFILPITSVPPASERLSMEVPQIERRRAGLDDMPLWIILDEYNHDLLENSFYFDPSARVGSFSSAFCRKVLQTFVRATKDRRAKRVPRTD